MQHATHVGTRQQCNNGQHGVDQAGRQAANVEMVARVARLRLHHGARKAIEHKAWGTLRVGLRRQTQAGHTIIVVYQVVQSNHMQWARTH